MIGEPKIGARARQPDVAGPIMVMLKERSHGACRRDLRMAGPPFLRYWVIGDRDASFDIEVGGAGRERRFRRRTSEHGLYETWAIEIADPVRDGAAEAGGSARMRSDEPESDLPTGVAKPARRALAAAGYARREHMAKASEAELLKLHGVGPKAIDLIRRALAADGRSFDNGA